MKDRAKNEWVFFRDLAGRWRWEHHIRGATVQQSMQSHATREACVADAARYGFDAVPPVRTPGTHNLGGKLT
jgi:hypothetical protein